jgi:hypothetical protein
LAGFGLGAAEDDGFAHCLHSYLTAYCYFLSLSLGALFFVALQHVTRAGWSVTLRRLAELAAAPMPLLAVLFLPILVPVLLGSDALFPWNNAERVAEDELLRHKAPYLNASFFAARAAFYLLVWWLASRFYLRNSVAQDASDDPALTLRMERGSPIILLLYAVTVTFASFDWLMSLTPDWFSTIFGVYWFAGAVVAALAALILAATGLQSTGRLASCITVEHYHDLGKLLLAFVIFWGYVAFSQYLLIWYANIPEETVWYLPRQSGFWRAVILLLLVGHLLIPLAGLLPRAVKRRKPLLAFWAAWLLAMHWFDLFWLVMPSLEPEGRPPGAIDALCLVGVGGIWLAGVLLVANGKSLVPLADPRLREALEFEDS